MIGKHLRLGESGFGGYIIMHFVVHLMSTCFPFGTHNKFVHNRGQCAFGRIIDTARIQYYWNLK